MVYVVIKISVDSLEVCCGRTLIINPTQGVKKAYCFLFEVLGGIVNFQKSCPLNILAGKIKNSADTIDSDMAQYLVQSYGYGSKSKVIEDTSKDLTVPGEVYTLTLCLKDVPINDNFKVSQNNVTFLIFESFFILELGPAKCLTEIVKEYNDISYSLEDEEKVIQKIDIKELENKGILRSSRLRHQVNSDQVEREKKRKERQVELRIEKNEELKQRYANFDGDLKRGVIRQRSLAEVNSYMSKENFPDAAKSNLIFVDTRHDSILLPVHGQIVPFHVSTVKNVSKNEEGKFHILRVNFVHPGAGIGRDSKYLLPELTDANNYYIKELTFRSMNPRNITNSFKTLKELIKKVKALNIEEKDKNSLISQEKLMLIKGKRPTLQDVTIRPNISGKKTQGFLESHQNGLRFTSTKSDKVDIIYTNIKHGIFQPVENELIVLLHFRLRNPIMVGGKKTFDVQFYTEAGVISDDLDMRRRNGVDLDEIQAEQRERKFKEKLNKEFKNFVESVQAISNETIDFDIPYRELGFYGVAYKANVLIMPSVNCLVSLIEQPFFVVTLSDIEISHFERVQFNLKNFDLVLIFKDYSVPPIRICTIPAEFLDPIKDWLNDIDIIYSESLNPLNWVNVMKEITKDLKGFVEEGGWNFLQESESEASDKEEENSIEDDSEFSEGEMDEDSEESEYSGEDSEAEESESEAEESEDSGLDWEEHEALAKKMDKRTIAKDSKGIKKAKK